MVTRSTRAGRRSKSARRGEHSLSAESLYGTLDVDALIRDQGVQPVERLQNLATDVWPKDEDVDEFVEIVYRWRREER